MISPNSILGTLLHGIGAISASACYVPFQKVRKWSWDSYWLIQATFAWLIFPLVIGYLTVPDLFEVFAEASTDVLFYATFLGIIYGFGGMCFGFAIKHIGYSLTYTISIGLSAVLGTIVPLIIHGELTEKLNTEGGNLIFLGMAIAVVGIILCGVAGYKKEKDLKLQINKTSSANFKMKLGLTLTIIAGVLSAVFGISLDVGSPVAAIAASHGAGHFQGNANLILSTGGAFITNFIWFTVAGIRNKTIREIVSVKSIGVKSMLINFGMSILSGALWYGQFFFYGMAHVRMGSSKYISWVLHMSLLIFFSYLIGVVLKEWVEVSKKTYLILILALIILVISFVVMTYGSMLI
ncbi:MAG: rhamnose:proton symporter [Cyclobacteriaceae bacterium]